MLVKRLIGLAVSLSATWLFVGGAAAHPISIIEADAYASRTKLTLRLTIFAEDLYMFHELEPNEKDLFDPQDLEEAMEKHKAFLLDKVILRNAEGKRLSGKVTDLKPFDMPEEGVDINDLMLYLLVYTLEYRFEEPPKFLTFSQEVTDENFLRPSEMKLWVKQSGGGAAFTAVLRPGNHETVRLDWEHPPLSEEASDEEWEKWIDGQREKTLGITSYGSVYSFIYINRREVRHEILIPLMTLASLIEIKREDPSFLEVAEQTQARSDIEQFFHDVCSVKIDNLPVGPKFDRVDFYGLDLRDFAQRPGPRKVSMASGRVGVIVSYGAKSSPREVNLTWEKFNAKIRKVESVVFAFDQPLKTTFSRFQEDNTFRWSDPERPPLPKIQQVKGELPLPPQITLPAASLMCIAGLLFSWPALAAWKLSWRPRLATTGVLLTAAVLVWPLAQIKVNQPFAAPPPIASSQARDIFNSLHGNIYRAFDYRDETDIYDALSVSIDGQMLQAIYLQIHKGLLIQEQGGAVAQVKEVQHIEGRPIESELPQAAGRGFRYQSTWTVNGVVEHWGHIHERTNRYTALFDVEVHDNAWKITGMKILDDERVASKTRLRKF